jgi:hypothetical protein
MNEAALYREMSCAINPVAFARRLGIEPDSGQQDVLLSTEKRMMILAARQSGKSTICAIYALWHALNNPGALVLVLSPSLRQSSLLFRTITAYYQDLGRPIPSDVENTRTLELANKSMIVSLPGLERTTRGFSGVSLLILDESALIDDDLYRAVRPMLAVSDGKIFAIGTPHGKRGWFYHTWAESEEFRKIKITADQCPRISKEFLREERKALGQYWFMQEYECTFTESDDTLFSYAVIRRAVGDHDEIPIDWGDDSEDDPQDVPPGGRDFPRLGTAEEIHFDF